MFIIKTSARNDFTLITKEIIVTIIIILIPILVELIFKLDFLRDSYRYICIGVILSQITVELSKDRIKEVTIDSEINKICIIYTRLFSKPKKVLLSFENAVIEHIKPDKKLKWLFGNEKTIYFLNNKVELIKLNSKKDGFSFDAIDNFLTEIRKLSIAIKEV